MNVTHPEHLPETPRAHSGLFVLLRAFLRDQISGRSRHRSVGRRARQALGVVSMVAVAAGGLLLAAPSLATNPPKFRPELREEKLFSTRAHIEAEFENGGGEVEWKGEYATSESGPWIAAGSGATGQPGGGPVSSVALGQIVQNGADNAFLHHLSPSTSYYARFHASNSAGSAEKTFKFTTTAVARPEIAQGTLKLVFGQPTPTTARFQVELETNGAATEYHFEYATSKGGPWQAFTSGGSGAVSVAEDFAEPVAGLTGLTPETTYFVRVTASNEKGVVEQETSFTTPTAKPVASVTGARNVTATSGHIVGQILPHHLMTSWRFESTTEPDNPASWASIPGAVGAITQAQASALPENAARPVEVTMNGLKPSTIYYVRLFAENEAGEGLNPFGEPISTETRGLESFQTSGAPTASTFAVHALNGESTRVLAAVDPRSAPTSEEQTVTVEGAPTGGSFTLTFKGQTTEPIEFDAPGEGPGSVSLALNALSTTVGSVIITGPDGGPYNVYFYGANGGVDQPQIEADHSGLTPSGTVTVETTQQGGEAYDANYHFEYVPEKQFNATNGEGGFARAISTPEVDIGSGAQKFAGADLTGLEYGEIYHYRIVVTNTSPGNPVVYGEEEILTAPTPAPTEDPATCPNEARRTGFSAGLPDCRAYEQLTPIDKEGAKEPFNYGGGAEGNGALISEDGDHIALDAEAVDWGSGPEAGLSPYFFSRDPEKGWQMTSGAPQPQTGVATVRPQIYSPSLSSFGFSSGFETSPANKSEEIEYKVGPPGGPYATVATVPRKQAGEGWVAASADFTKLILQVEDHALLDPEHPTGTAHDSDLYEYSDGQLRQVNVNSQGGKLGSCGAHVVKGGEESGILTSAHAVSADGSRVFFEAVPGNNCSASSQLYMRINGAQTIDIGPYHFAAADPQGTKLLLEKESGGASEFFIYDAESAATTPLVGLALHQAPGNLIVAEDLTAIYFESTERLTTDAPPPGEVSSHTGNVLESLPVAGNLYRYDISTKTLSFMVQSASSSSYHPPFTTPDGRYLYFESRAVSGLPGGGLDLAAEQQDGAELPAKQVYRYDSIENVIQCMSCSSSFDPEPRLGAVFGGRSPSEGRGSTMDGVPNLTLISAKGDFAFFETPAALVPSDVDGEAPPEHVLGLNPENGSQNSEHSLSGDVYEWRRDGVDGCLHLQGCLALITNGRGGYLNLLLGATPSGHDVFVYTRSELVSSDNDTAADIYDVRVDGGLPPPPPRPVECEGDACSTPFAPPNDPTPSTFTSQGAGNLLSPMGPIVKPKLKPKVKSKLKTKCKMKAKRKCKAQVKKKNRKQARRSARARHAKTSGRTGA
jgi:hypothetical protein